MEGVGDGLAKNLYTHTHTHTHISDIQQILRYHLGFKEKEHRIKSAGEDMGLIFQPDCVREEWIQNSGLTLILT